MTNTNDKERAYVVFQGGGALGIAHFGAWKIIEENFEIVGVAGTSSGSIAAALCAARCSPDEAFESFKQNLPKFGIYKNLQWSIVKIIFRAFLGLNASNDVTSVKNWLEQQFKQSELKKDNINFADLYKHNGIYLEVVACDLNDPNNHTIFYSIENRSYEPISRVVSASIALPGFFKPIRNENRVLSDGGITLNFPIQNVYERAKKEEAVLIGVRFKKSQRSFNLFDIRQVLLKIYEIMMDKSSQIPEEINIYPKSLIIEIDDRGFNPLNFKLKEDQMFELKEAGEQVAREQLEKLKNKLKEVKSKLRSKLSPETRESVDQAQSWFNHDVLPKIENYCKSALKLDKFRDLDVDEYKFGRFCWEINKYVKRISESLLNQNNALLRDNFLKRSLSNIDVYLEVLNMIKEEIPDYLNKKEDIKNRIDYLCENLSNINR